MEEKHSWTHRQTGQEMGDRPRDSEKNRPTQMVGAGVGKMSL